MYGLQCIEDGVEARAILTALTPKVEGCVEPFSAQHVGNALYGSPSEQCRGQLRACIGESPLGIYRE